MSKWWYWSTIKCPECGATGSRYDASAPWYDSGLSSSSVIKELCEECSIAKQAGSSSPPAAD